MMASSKISSFYLFAVSFLLAGWVWVTYHAFYAGSSGISVCHIKNLTGLPCPSCGITSSVTSIMSAHFAAAWSYNPLGYLALSALLMIPLLLLADIFGKRTRSYQLYITIETHIKKKRYIQVAFALLILINWTYILWK